MVVYFFFVFFMNNKTIKILLKIKLNICMASNASFGF
jgi:hypothetical protein